MANLDRARKARMPIRSSVTRLEREVEAGLAVDPVDRQFLQVLTMRVDKLEAKLTEANAKVEDAMLDDDTITGIEMEEEREKIDEYDDKLNMVKIKLSSVLNTTSYPSPPASITGSANSAAMGHNKSLHLKKLELRQFGGDLDKWLSWWAQFKVIHEDTSMAVNVKFHYLQQAVVPGSVGERAIKQFPETEENYPKVIETLKRRFGDEKMLRQLYIRGLLSLVMVREKNSRKPGFASELYDQLAGRLRNLESLGKITDATEFLFPLVESSLPPDMLLDWQKSPIKAKLAEANNTKSKLEALMEFLEKEVSDEQERSLVTGGFAKMSVSGKSRGGKGQVQYTEEDVPTAAGLVAGQARGCVFCGGGHRTENCNRGKKMSNEERKRKLRDQKVCFVCFRDNHMASKCQSKIKCLDCEGRHFAIMCDQSGRKDVSAPAEVVEPANALAAKCVSDVLLGAVRVRIHGRSGWRQGLLGIDTYAQRSCILERVALEVGCQKTGQIISDYILYGGGRTGEQTENVYQVGVEDFNSENQRMLSLVGKREICGEVPLVPNGPWIREMRKKKISINNRGIGSAEIAILVGADQWNRVVRETRPRVLECGLVAMETAFGWTLSGALPGDRKVTALSMFIGQASVQDLWRLETIGIRDPIEVQTKEEQEKEAMQHFRENVSTLKNGRLCVRLPWMKGRPYLPTNKNIATKRLIATSNRLTFEQKQLYDQVFQDWKGLGIIEVVEGDEEVGHYLPHRPVFKPKSATTPVRPVFDASCKATRSASLNDCLYKGPNMIDKIPEILCRFREKKIGLVSDIKKAFPMIAVDERDRDFLRFLWWEDETCKKMVTFRHCRVVFGITSSPFLLAAVLEKIIDEASPEFRKQAEKLRKSLYVDNNVTSVEDDEEYARYKKLTTELLARAQMDLCQWERSGEKRESPTSVLGLLWDHASDVLSFVIEELNFQETPTKKTLLSAIAKIYDPIGVLAPALLGPKKLLQKAWKNNKDWKTPLETDDVNILKKWSSELKSLAEIKIPRQMVFGSQENLQLHVFSDASKDAYGAVVYIRSVANDSVKIELAAAKARVAPMKKNTIPRLELLSCLVGARLMDTVWRALNMKDVPRFYWTDSTTALAWITRSAEWGIFIANRRTEILQLSDVKNWRHVPGEMNPADLPSRGCSPGQLLSSKWWECRQWRWLYLEESNWPNPEEDVDETAVSAELKRGQAVLVMKTVDKEWFVFRYSSYMKNVRVMAWVFKFVRNLRNRAASGTRLGALANTSTRQESLRLDKEDIRQGELKLLALVQYQSFGGDHKTQNWGKRFRVEKIEGVLRVKTSLLNRNDSEYFRLPILLPRRHFIVECLIKELHVLEDHPGPQTLVGKLREKYWILQARRAVRDVLLGCVSCRRHRCKPFDVEPTALPERRVADGQVFATTGVDLAGPLQLRDGSKVWIVLYTCAVYRCVALDVVDSLSTEAFLKCLQRFVNHYGRPITFNSDNGTNFVCTSNIMKELDWKSLEQESQVKKMNWVFIPPAAPWWGGWWERLIGVMKEQLRSMLGRARLTYEEMRTCIGTVAATMNERPLCTVTEDGDDLIALTPAMFLHFTRVAQFPEGEKIGAKVLRGRYAKLQSLQQQLRARFRNEYLAQLVQRGCEKKTREPIVGEVVLVGMDNKKRVYWPLGRIVELVPGKDGKVRVAKVRIATGHVLDRPLQRLYPLEIRNGYEMPTTGICKKFARVEPPMEPEPEVVGHDEEPLKTRAGRFVKKPRRYGQMCFMLM